MPLRCQTPALQAVRWLIGLYTIALLTAGVPTTAAAISEADSRQLKALRVQLGEAQLQKDERKVLELTGAARRILGDTAGTPEVPDEFKPAPAQVDPLTTAELQGAIEPMLKGLPKFKWWRIDLDPTRTEHLPREAASVVTGMAAAARAKVNQSAEAIVAARDAADYLIWTQAQAGAGVFPFPNVRSNSNRALQVGTDFMRKAEQAGKLDAIVRNGWVFDDLGGGGLQFDNALCGVAMLELYSVTQDKKYLDSAKAAGDWAMKQSVVTNWNYNSFSVWLLSRLYSVTGDDKYLQSAKLKARLGVYPGQLTDGPRSGRWMDAHNARPAYHYILVRGIASLAAAMKPDDPDRERAITSLRLALVTRNTEFVTQGISNKDSALEGMLAVVRLPKSDETQLRATQTREAIAVVERQITAEYRTGKLPLSPAVWGLFIEWKSENRQ